MTPQAGIAVVVGTVATIEDLAHRRISNWIPAGALVAGVILQTMDRGWRGTVGALLGAVVGFCVFLIFYLLGGMGGGDIKLMAGFGAVLGVGRILVASLWVAGCGGLLAAVVIAISTLRGLLRTRRSIPSATDEASEKSRTVDRPKSIPYAPAIAAGVWLSLVP